MADCDKFALNQLQRDMIMDDLAGRLKVKKERILARWEKYKSLTQSSQSILDVSSSSTTSTTSSAPSTKSATSSTSQASTAPKIESVQKQQLLKMANMTCAKLSEMLKEGEYSISYAGINRVILHLSFQKSIAVCLVWKPNIGNWPTKLL